MEVSLIVVYALVHNIGKNISSAKLIAVGITHERFCSSMNQTNLEKLTADYYAGLIGKELANLEKIDAFCPSITDDNEASPIAGCNLATQKYASKRQNWKNWKIGNFRFQHCLFFLFFLCNFFPILQFYNFLTYLHFVCSHVDISLLDSRICLLLGARPTLLPYWRPLSFRATNR
jgi:hypothetical protein